MLQSHGGVMTTYAASIQRLQGNSWCRGCPPPHALSLPAQGQHPLPYAIAELVDNSLQATRQNHLRGVQRDVEVTFLVGSRGGAFISVWDNGRGMTAAELGQWAVMNLAVADRQAAATVDITPSQAVGRGTQREPPPAERYLSGELSYFGVRRNIPSIPSTPPAPPPVYLFVSNHPELSEGIADVLYALATIIIKLFSRRHCCG